MHPPVDTRSMSNVTYLLGHDSPAARSIWLTEEEPAVKLLEASCQMPILWLSLFRTVDLTTCRAEETIYDVTSVVDVPTLVTPTRAGITRSRRRAAVVRAILDPRLHVHIEEWFAFLATRPEPFLQLDAFELWEMREPEYFVPELKAFLGAFRSPTSRAWRALLAQAAVDIPKVARFGIRGYACDVAVTRGQD